MQGEGSGLKSGVVMMTRMFLVALVMVVEGVV